MLLLQDVLALSPAHQLSLLQLLSSAAQATASVASASTVSAAAVASSTVTSSQLLPLLRLVTDSKVERVRAEARQLLAANLSHFCDEHEDVLIWIACLPVCPDLIDDCIADKSDLHLTPSPDQVSRSASSKPRCVADVAKSKSATDMTTARSSWEAVLNFLAEAVAAVARKPHEYYELAHELLQQGGHATAHGHQVGMTNDATDCCAKPACCIASAVSCCI